MFTGIVEAALPLLAVEDAGVRRLTVDLAPLAEAASVRLGDSVALNGCCLTVARLSGLQATFEAVPETLSRTSLGSLGRGSLVNVERALKAGGRLDGHIVQGHVDACAPVGAIARSGAEWRIRVDCGPEFAAQCVPKGSVCVDGVSLTIAELGEADFTVAVIPHTREVTSVRCWQPGTAVNLEADVLGKYVLRYMQRLTSGQPLPRPTSLTGKSLTEEALRAFRG